MKSGNCPISQEAKATRQSVNRIYDEHFAEKSYKKCAGETIPRPLSKKSKLNVSLDQ